MSLNGRNERKVRISDITRGALIAAAVFVMTAFLKIPMALGYVHLGDGAVLFAAALLPFPVAPISVAIGASLADLAAGYPAWMLPTAIIKLLMTLAFTSKARKLLCTRNFIAMALAIAINTAGYYLAGSIIYGDMRVCLPEIPLNIVQTLCGAVIFVVFGAFVDSKSKLGSIIRGKKW